MLTPEERAKGLAPAVVRRNYRQLAGPVGPQYPRRDLTDEEKERYNEFGYVKFEPYPESESPKTGCFWTFTARLEKAWATAAAP